MNLTIRRLRSPFLACLALAAFAWAGCETTALHKTNPNATEKEKAIAAIHDAENGLKWVVGPAVTSWLILAKDDAQRQQDAAWVYAGANALNTLATGQIMTPDQVKTTIASFTQKGDPRYAALASLLVSEYANVFTSFKVSETSPAKFFAEIAIDAQNAAQPFLKPPGS